MSLQKIFFILIATIGFGLPHLGWTGSCPEELSNSPEKRRILPASDFQKWGTQGPNWILRPATEEDREFVLVILNTEQNLDMENIVANQEQKDLGFTRSLLPEFPGYQNTVGFQKVIMDPINHQRIGSFSGYIQPDTEKKLMATIGYSLLPEFWNRGIATSVLQSVLKVLPNYGIDWVMAACSSDNLASNRVLLKAGFEFWRDFDPREWEMTYRRPVSSKLYFYDCAPSS